MPDLLGRFEAQQWFALMVSVFACGTDIRVRRIPNIITFGGAAGALVFAFLAHGPKGLLVAVLGWLVGLAVFMPFYLLRGLGAGDVKLMACLGAWLGPAGAVWTALYGAMAGGVMAILTALASNYFRTAMRNTAELIMHFRTVGVRPHPVLALQHSSGPRLPYALPITAGAIAAMWLH